MMVQNDHVIHWIGFFPPLNHVPCASFYQGLWISIKMSLMNSIHPNFANCAQGHFSLCGAYQISFVNA